MRAVIYSRYSAGPDQTIQSIEGQLRVCKNYIASHGWDYAGYYADEHISGRTDQRPQFQEMISAAERGEFDVLVVYSTDRFSRNKYDSINYKQKLKKLGIKIAYAAENIPDGPEGILLESLMEGWAEYYSEELSRKVKRGMHDTATKCKSTGGNRTFGYRTGPDGKLVVDEEEAEAVRTMYKMIAEGGKVAECVRWLRDQGFVNRRGKPYGLTTVRYCLSNDRYLGIFKFDDVIIPGGQPAIIDKTLYDEVQQRLEENKKAMPKNRIKYVLSGKMICGCCGEPMSGRSGTGRSGQKYYYYACRNKCIKNIPKEEIESLIAAETAAFFNSPSEMGQLVDMLYYYMVQKNASERDSRVPKMRIDELIKQRDNLVTVIAQTGNATLVEKLNEVEFELVRLEVLEKQKKKPKTFTKEELELSLKVFLDRVDRLDPETADRRIIDALIKEVILYSDHLEIIFNIQIDPEDRDHQKQTTVFAEHNTWWAKCKPGRTIIARAGHVGISI